MKRVAIFLAISLANITLANARLPDIAKAWKCGEVTVILVEYEGPRYELNFSGPIIDWKAGNGFSFKYAAIECVEETTPQEFQDLASWQPKPEKFITLAVFTGFVCNVYDIVL